MTATAVVDVDAIPAPHGEDGDVLTLVQPVEDRQLALDTIALLQDSGHMTPTDLDLSDANLSLDQMVSLGRWLGGIKRFSSWWIGGWLIRGEGTYGERFAQAMTATGLTRETLSYYAYVYSRVGPKRRRSDLGFSHHHAVAELGAAQQTRWLTRAAKEQWTAAELRKAIKDQLALDAGEQTGLDDGDGPGSLTRAELLDEIGRAILRDAVEDIGGQHYLVPKEDVARLRALYDAEA